MSNTTVVVNGSSILNPFSPLVFLPPELAFQVRISRYIVVGTLGAFVWDILNNIKSDCILVCQRRIRLQTIIYFLSKLSSLGYVLGSTILQTASISSCNNSEIGLEVLFSLAIPSTCLLFLFRVRAVFNMNPWVVALFGGLWLAVPAGCLTTIVGITATNIGPTHLCIAGHIKSYTAVAIMIPLIFDTLVFLAISWRLWANSYASRTIREGIRVWVFGDYLPAFSRSMLQDGQAYYLTTVTAHLLTMIMICINSVPFTYRTVFTIPNVALMNIMACRVYRNTMFGLFNENEIASIISRDFRAASAPMISEDPGSRTKQGVNVTLNTTHVATLNDITIARTVHPTVEDFSTGDQDKNQKEISLMV